MIYTKLTVKAMKIAYQAHHGQTDVNGVPYIFHPYHIAEQMNDEITTCAALLHDVAEDTNITLDELKNEFPPEVINALRLLTHNDGADYFDYIRAIKSDPVAKAVKLADITHNSDQSRIVDKTAVSQDKIKAWHIKYETAYRILTGKE